MTLSREYRAGDRSGLQVYNSWLPALKSGRGLSDIDGVMHHKGTNAFLFIEIKRNLDAFFGGHPVGQCILGSGLVKQPNTAFVFLEEPLNGQVRYFLPLPGRQGLVSEEYSLSLGALVRAFEFFDATGQIPRAFDSRTPEQDMKSAIWELEIDSDLLA